MRKTNSRSALFLGEVVLAMLIFSLSSAVCVGLLFRAYSISEASNDLNQAVFCAQSAAEVFKSQPDLEKAALLLGGDIRSGQCVIYYNDNWHKTTGQDAVYTLLIIPSYSADAAYATISIGKGADLIFELNTAVYGGGV